MVMTPLDSISARIPARSAMANALRRRLWKLAFGDAQEALGPFFLNPSDHIGRERLVSGAPYEEEYLGVLEQLLGPLGLGRGTALDVGANIGNHACWLTHRFAHVIAVEPGRVAALVLEANLVSTGRDNWEIWNCALGDREGTGRLERVIVGNLGSSRIAADDGATGERLQVATGDAKMQARECPNLPLELIKIDVEGAELAVLTGLKNTIQEWQPLVCFESWEEAQLSDLTDCLGAMGYVQFFAPKPVISPKGMMNRIHSVLFGIRWDFKPLAKNFPEDGYGMVFGFCDHHINKIEW